MDPVVRRSHQSHQIDCTCHKCHGKCKNPVKVPWYVVNGTRVVCDDCQSGVHVGQIQMAEGLGTTTDANTIGQ